VVRVEVTSNGCVVPIPTEETTFWKEESPLKNVSVFALPEPSLDGSTVPLMMLDASIEELAFKDQLVASEDDVLTVAS